MLAHVLKEIGESGGCVHSSLGKPGSVYTSNETIYFTVTVDDAIAGTCIEGNWNIRGWCPLLAGETQKCIYQQRDDLFQVH
jgi:Fe-S-cluster containining protein